jgi:hypothetical protein
MQPVALRPSAETFNDVGDDRVHGPAYLRAEFVALVCRKFQGYEMDPDEEIVGPLPGDQPMVMKGRVLGHALAKATIMPTRLTCLTRPTCPRAS